MKTKKSLVEKCIRKCALYGMSIKMPYLNQTNILLNINAFVKNFKPIKRIFSILNKNKRFTNVHKVKQHQGVAEEQKNIRGKLYKKKITEDS